MSLHIGDYKKDTGHLRAAGHGAYLLLIMHYWATGGLPDDDRQLATIACMSDREWKQHKPIIQAFFDDGWDHGRIEDEYSAALAKYKNRAGAGKLGGEAKAKRRKKPSNATPVLQQNGSNDVANAYQPITLTNKEEKEDAAGARARDADRIMVAIGVDDNPNWFGYRHRIVEWTKTWDVDLDILPTVQRIMANRTKPPKTPSYFEDAIAEHRASRTAPLPVATPEKRHVSAGSRPAKGSAVTDAIDKHIEQFDRLAHGGSSEAG